MEQCSYFYGRSTAACYPAVLHDTTIIKFRSSIITVTCATAVCLSTPYAYLSTADSYPSTAYTYIARRRPGLPNPKPLSDMLEIFV